MRRFPTTKGHGARPSTLANAWLSLNVFDISPLWLHLRSLKLAEMQHLREARLITILDEAEILERAGGRFDLLFGNWIRIWLRLCQIKLARRGSECWRFDGVVKVL